jgi:hypothetical protein
MNEDRSHHWQFITPEFSLICSLCSLGLQVSQFKKESPTSKRVLAVFDDSPELQSLVSDFWNQKLRIEPIAYSKKAKELNRLIRQVIDQRKY